MENDKLIEKIASILGVTVNMVKHRLSLENQIEMLVEKYEQLEEFNRGEIYESIPD